MARPGRLLLAAALLLGLRYCFVPSPEQQPKGSEFNPAVAASAALPALTMLAQDAEAKYGDQRKFAAVLVPLTTLVFPAVAMGMFVCTPFRRMPSGALSQEPSVPGSLTKPGGSTLFSPTPRTLWMASSTLTTTKLGSELNLPKLNHPRHPKPYTGAFLKSTVTEQPRRKDWRRPGSVPSLLAAL